MADGLLEEFKSENLLECSQSLGSPQTLSQAKRWIEDCTERHNEACAEHSPWRPTRLLDSGPFESTDPIIVTLRESFPAAPVITDPYMTLSYRWGLEAPLTLTKKTCARLYAGVPLHDLPKAFQDAIHISRWLGKRYLWIDALCIYQDKDDLSDWQRESSQMHSVYSNSWCNISATMGENSSSSIIRYRRKDTLRQDRIQIAWHQDGAVTVLTYRLYDKDLWSTCVANAPVNKRGWVLQERLLSPRTLYFTDTQLFWECSRAHLCEMYPNNKESRMTLREEYLVDTYDWAPLCKNNARSTQNGQFGVDEFHKHHYRWFELVQSYSACTLTVPTDKLVAISALARRLQTYIQDDYVAGMWRKSLEADLLWRVREPDTPRSISSPYIAPSWSWASTNVELDYLWSHSLEARPLTVVSHVEDLQFRYVNEQDHFGALKGGRLRLRGHLQRVWLPIASGSFPDPTCLSNEEMISLFQDAWRGYGIVRINDSAFNFHSRTGRQLGLFLDRYPDKEFHDQINNEKLFCMLMLTQDEPCDTWLFLLLEEVPAAEEGTFRRVGALELLFWGENDSGRVDVEWAATSVHPDEASFPCIQYRDGVHSIWII